MSAFFHGAEAFFDHLAAIHWGFLALAVLCHLMRTACVSRAWFNILRASYPRKRIRWREIYGAYVAGVGVNAIIPARVGDLAKLYIAKRRVPESTYTTLATTQVALNVFDFAAASLLLLWALVAGVLPGLSVLPHLPDAGWFLQHYKLMLNIFLVIVVVTLVGLVLAAHRIRDFKDRVAQGFAIFRDRPTYFSKVALWQATDWMLRFVAIYLFLRAFGIPASFHNALLIQVAQSLLTVFPFTPSGAGTEQALILYMLGSQASRSSLLAFAVGMKLTVVAVNVAIGFGAIAVMLKTLSWRQAAEADRAAEAAKRAGPAPAGETPRT
ncbi:MAG TPA: lysylphosphatidylglycerol synthase transmembrane domain-containing protein [Gaiellaceae bacterium]